MQRLTRVKCGHYDFTTLSEVEIRHPGMLQRGEVEISFGSQYGYLDLVQDISDRVSRMVGLDEETCYRVGLSIRESVTNAIQHGNKLDESKKVEVRFKITPDRLVVCVQDQGQGFDESTVPDPLDAENLLKPGGRGIFYVRSFMDNVCYRTLPQGGTEIRMEKMLNCKNEGGDNED